MADVDARRGSSRTRTAVPGTASWQESWLLTLVGLPVSSWWQWLSAAGSGAHQASQNTEALGLAANIRTMERMVARSTDDSSWMIAKVGPPLCSPLHRRVFAFRGLLHFAAAARGEGGAEISAGHGEIRH